VLRKSHPDQRWRLEAPMTSIPGVPPTCFPWTRTTVVVLVVILVFIIFMIALGCSPVAAAGVAVAAAAAALGRAPLDTTI
jgi:hypothetical protein